MIETIEQLRAARAAVPKTVLQAIKQHPTAFLMSSKRRATHTHSESNKRSHNALGAAIVQGDWETVKTIITDPKYYTGFVGLVYTLDRDHLGPKYQIITKLMDDNKLV